VIREAKSGAAALSIASNAVLIALKLAAGAVTGSIAIITEAIHSSIDLIASVIAFVSVKKAEEPADETHPYGHEKVENLSAAIEGMLILVGAGIIVYEAVRRLATGAEVHSLGFGIAVIAFSMVANAAVSTYLYRQARLHDSPALEGDAAHLRTDAFTSFGVLVGLVAVELTGEQSLDALVAISTCTSSSVPAPLWRGRTGSPTSFRTRSGRGSRTPTCSSTSSRSGLRIGPPDRTALQPKPARAG
jgi:cation diffusion facilitator family transporter